MTVAEFKKMVALIPDTADEYEMSSYTDIGEIRGVWVDEERELVWLSEKPDVSTTSGVF